MFAIKPHHGGISVPNMDESINWSTPMGFLRDNSGNLLELIQFPALWPAFGERS